MQIVSGRIEIIGDRAEQPEPGRLARAIVDYGQGIEDLEIEAVRSPDQADMFVYCRRVDDTLPETAAVSETTDTPLALLSSGLDVSRYDSPNFPFIVVPNSALGVIDYLKEVADAAAEHEGWGVSIVEHHQPSKKDTSGTAKKLADMLGIDYENIESVRDWDLSHEQYGIPEQSRDGYAVHSVSFRDPETGDSTDPLEIVVHGREVYAQGVLDIYRATQDPNFKEEFVSGKIDIVDLVSRGIVKATNL